MAKRKKRLSDFAKKTARKARSPTKKLRRSKGATAKQKRRATSANRPSIRKRSVPEKSGSRLNKKSNKTKRVMI